VNTLRIEYPPAFELVQMLDKLTGLELKLFCDDTLNTLAVAMNAFEAKYPEEFASWQYLISLKTGGHTQ